MTTLEQANLSPVRTQSARAYGIGQQSDAPALPRTVSRWAMTALFGTTLFLSSALLFFVEPMFARFVLPRLGGTAAVWNTCLVFFQACLLAGYAYSHLITRRLRIGHQVLLHAALLTLPLMLLPLGIPQTWKPPAAANPVPSLLLLLTLSVGLPFFVVSTTAPLVQRWFSATGHPHAADPYALYAASNIGSMVALLAYPTIVEPLFRLGSQSQFWTFGYLGFALLVLGCGILATIITRASGTSSINATPDRDFPDLEFARSGGWLQRLRWVLLAASFLPVIS